MSGKCTIVALLGKHAENFGAFGFRSLLLRYYCYVVYGDIYFPVVSY
jgi:hypothetical protein